MLLVIQGTRISNNNNNNADPDYYYNALEQQKADILLKFWSIKNDPSIDEVEIKDVDLDMSMASALMSALVGDASNMRTYKAVKIINCRGEVNDLLMACCSSHRQSIQRLEFAHLAPLESSNIFALNFALCYNRPLIHLKLQIYTIDRDASDTLARAVARNTWLETLDLSSSSLTSSAIGPLSFGLRINRTLKALILDGCRLEDSDMTVILQALLEHPTLAKLSIQQNACHEGMSAIASLLHYNTALEMLDMSYLVRQRKQETPPAPPEPEEEKTEDTQATEQTNEPSSDDVPAEEQKEETTNGEQETEEAPADQDNEAQEQDTGPQTTEEPQEEEDSNQVRNFTLKSFQIAGNSLDDSFVESVLRIFGSTSEKSALQELNLFGNRITDRGVEMLVRQLPKLPNLQRIMLGHNRFGPFAAAKLVEVLESNYSIDQVSIRSYDEALEPYQARLEYLASLNHYGRRVLAAQAQGANQVESEIPKSLWPYIVDRTSRLDRKALDDDDEPSETFARDAIFWLLRGPVFF